MNRSLGLPLLAKELVEQSARARTYVVRFIYGSLLFLAGFAIYNQIVGQFSAMSPFAVLGRGGELFRAIAYMQFVGIFIFMPAMTCGVVTIEKERSSLDLLFLTRLGPWAIVLEKFLGRVIPMLAFLILTLPMLVIAYSLGGLSQQVLWCGVWFLFLSTLQVGSLAILCSTFFRTTVASFIGTYLLGVVMLFWLPVLNDLAGWIWLERMDRLLLQVRTSTTGLDQESGFRPPSTAYCCSRTSLDAQCRSVNSPLRVFRWSCRRLSLCSWHAFSWFLEHSCRPRI